MLHGRATNSN